MNRLRTRGTILRDGDSLLLSQTEFNREIARERIRATRRCIPFCVVTIDLTKGKQLGKRRAGLVRILHRNLRLTDHKAHLGNNRFAVLLVDTTESGGQAVLERLTALCAVKQLNTNLSLRVHDPHGDEDSDSPPSLPTENGKRRRRHDDFDLNSVAETLGPPFSDEPHWRRVDAGDEHPPAMSEDGRSDHGNTDHGNTANFHEEAGYFGREGGTAVVNAPVHVSNLQSVRVDSVHAQRPPIKSTMLEAERFTEAEFAFYSGLTPASKMGRLVKRSVDLVGASVGLVLASPLLAGGAIAVKATSRGPVLFKQKREGLAGKPFTIYKMRTMVVDAESKQDELRKNNHRDGPAFKIKHDPRVTKVGQFLRKTCIDELPQLINVLKGEMSLVGPRPLPWKESRQCSDWQRRRLDVAPGMTCHWQINKAAAETFDDWMRMDLQYVDRNSVWQDLRLIACTVMVPITGRGSE